MVASRYDEVVVDRVFAGTTPLARALQPLVAAAKRTLALEDAARRSRPSCGLMPARGAWRM